MVLGEGTIHELRGLACLTLAPISQMYRERSGPLMAAIDACNARWGPRRRGAGPGAGLVAKRGWNTKFEMRTSRYTTQVGELPVAHA
ncbi:DUF4113 domain-containing protein [Methylobacterium guangdongense]|uniref:DUF4113 domain-containing protein n=1 Tax=Methylobacterium guangdongense TaxID=3138811 RepID=UPI00399C6B02